MNKMKAQELWKKFEHKYMTKSMENRLYLKKKLFCFQDRKGISLFQHLNDYNKILADLKIWMLRLVMRIKLFCY